MRRLSYHPSECIFDLIAASGPQEHYDILVECQTQCVAPAYDEGNTIGEGHDATSRALVDLVRAGILGVEGGVFEFTDYGFELVELTSSRESWIRPLNEHRQCYGD